MWSHDGSTRCGQEMISRPSGDHGLIEYYSQGLIEPEKPSDDSECYSQDKANLIPPELP